MDRYMFFRGMSGDFISTRLRSSSKTQETSNSFGKRKYRSNGDVLESKRAGENQPKLSSPSNFIIATVENMGNTCYVNAAIFYTLRFIPMFTNKLHDLVLKSGDLVTTKSKLNDSMELKLLRALHRNYLNMSQNERAERKNRNPIKPTSFLWAMRAIHPEFKDNTYVLLLIFQSKIQRIFLFDLFTINSQHDSAELLIKLLEWLEKCCDDLERVSAEYR